MSEQAVTKLKGAQLPPCPECGGSVTMLNRMGMSAQNSKCSGCGKTFRVVTPFAEGQVAKIRAIYAGVDPDAIFGNANLNILLAAPGGKL